MVEGSPLPLPDLTPGAVCKGCHLRIRDKYLLRVHDGLWHESCLQCVTCLEPLTHSCFLRDNKLYCRRDYINAPQRRLLCFGLHPTPPYRIPPHRIPPHPTPAHPTAPHHTPAQAALLRTPPESWLARAIMIEK
ncbi:hypothetical protein ACEWY4_014136 [Coilia grayii]|uniref:LIM zinc-binding domain-containing protein n=1 Tax=Coilia grayii TaxID=363190 RepID=A0ABD1JRM6_9TELE